MLGNVSLRKDMVSVPNDRQLLMDVPNLARGANGAGIGGIASGLRVLLGIEKSYLGGSSS